MAIQAGQYQGKRFKLFKHLGSARDPDKIRELEQLGQEYLSAHTPQLAFNFNPQSEEIFYKRGLKAQAARLTQAYDYLSGVYHRLGYDQLGNELLKHFVLIRVLEPASKVKSLYLLKKYFGLDYKKTTAFRQLGQLIKLKDEAIRLTIAYATAHLGFDFSLVFYDVTTLYFETHQSDDFRLNGFSKDNKINQPQILIGLMVNQTGFPVYYDLFPGNTYEGHTIIPLITQVKSRFQIQQLTVVADAGMLTKENLAELTHFGIDYIVGGKTKTLTLEQAAAVAVALNHRDGQLIRSGNLIFEYSAKRAKKDKADNDKQLKKAEYLLTHSGKILKRSSFIAAPKNKPVALNQKIIDKYRLLEGVKSYRTNVTNLPDRLLVNRYKDLWHVEQSFRIAKSDLQARPIYHRKKDSITYHLLIVFMALALSKVIEQEKRVSIQKVVEELKDVWTVNLRDDITGNSTLLTINTKPH
jgi:transposase